MNAGELGWIRAQVPAVIEEAARLRRGLPAAVSFDRKAAGAVFSAAEFDAVEEVLATDHRNRPETLLQILRLLRDLAGPDALRADPWRANDG